MTTYVYETIPKIPGIEPRRFEVRQSMKDAPLTADPETGEPVRRIITGGYGMIAQKSAAPAATTPARCAPGCACHRN
jgi:predicted nucleic acid-binding Zn ribbon protein